MSLIRSEMRTAFLTPTQHIVRVTRDGFRIHDEICSELVGRIKTIQLLRKLFDKGRLVCDSPDGIEARTGTLCAECRHPQCRPVLRIQLEQTVAERLLVIDLATTSARNLLVLHDDLEDQGGRIDDWPVRLTVEPRSYWGEVRFARVDVEGDGLYGGASFPSRNAATMT